MRIAKPKIGLLQNLQIRSRRVGSRLGGDEMRCDAEGKSAVDGAGSPPVC
jgi:hypothetical protein